MADPLAESGEVLVDGKRLETLRYSPTGQNATIVMLHEGLGSIAAWRNFPEQLAKRTGCGVLLYSRYGHGKSQRLTEKRSVDFMHHEAKVVLPEFLETFKIQRPILLGHSDGGSIALIYAGTCPDRVNALALEAPHVFVEDLSIASITRVGEVYKTSDLALKLRRYHQHPDEMFWGWNEVWLNPQFRAWNIEKYLGAISCPVLAIQGQQDEYGTGAQVTAIKKRLPHAETAVLPSCGHSPHRDQPAVTLETIANFVAALK